VVEIDIMNTLYICEGNLGRSQMAEAFHRAYYCSPVTSAGIKVDGHKGEHVPQNICDVMREVRVDILGHVAKPIDEEMLHFASRVVVLCEKEKCPDYVRRRPDVLYWAISDTKHEGIDGLREIRDEIQVNVLRIFHSK
jgi:protein-tyrosine-phosphatase